MLTTLNRRDQLVAEFSNSLAKRLVFSWKWYYITYVFRFWLLGRIHTLLSMISWEKCQEKLWVRYPFLWHLRDLYTHIARTVVRKRARVFMIARRIHFLNLLTEPRALFLWTRDKPSKIENCGIDTQQPWKGLFRGQRRDTISTTDRINTLHSHHCTTT